eukprot:365782-Chlamydomonas_euryale.AAC.6
MAKVRLVRACVVLSWEARHAWRGRPAWWRGQRDLMDRASCMLHRGFLTQHVLPVGHGSST